MGADILLSMAGGLGLFLFGMTVMSESIEKVAGARLRSILEMFTKNRFTGLIVGIIFTGVIQSSSACTVMVTPFMSTGAGLNSGQVISWSAFLSARSSTATL